jgi:LuxR family maltose regulon positive regulatory protein
MAVAFPFPHINTKLYIPAVRPDLVTRPRLHQRLNRCIEHKLLFVSAPAGSGKTMLLSQWSQQSEWPVVWVSLDVADNDPVHFWSYVAAALDKLEPKIGQRLLPMLHAPQPERTEFLIATFINLIALIPDHFVLVLDDYHCIEAEVIHTALTSLLDYLSPTMHLILASRVDPPLPLARWRARGQLMELREPDLRFSMDETETLLNQMIRLGLSRQEVMTLQERTEGWIAGLQLAALAIEDDARQEGRGMASLPDFRGDDRYLVDYLASEVLSQQPESLRVFLLQTAILSTLSGPLCAAVTGQANSQDMLEQLHRRNLFISALDRKGQYRYHPLFADFLHDQLQRDPAFQLSALHLRAANWYEQHDQLDQAIKHTLAAEEMVEAARLIQKTARQHLMRGESATLLNWFKALPDQVIHSQPLFCLVYAWVLTNSGQVEAAASYLDHLEAHLDQHEDANLLLGEAAIMRARIGAMRADLAQIAHFTQRALALLPVEAGLLRSDLFFDLAAIHRSNFDFEATQAAYREAINLGLATGHLRTTMVAIYYLADLYLSLGQFQQAARLYQQGLEECGQMPSSSALACWAHAGLGALLYEWNELTEAIHHLQRAVDLGQQSGEVKPLMYARITLAQALQSQGRPDEAVAAIQAAAEIAQQTNIIEIVRQIELTQVKLWLRQGQIDRAAAWLRQHGVGLQNKELLPHHLTALVWLHLVQNRTHPLLSSAGFDRIIDLVKARSETALAHKLVLPLVHELILLALAHQALGQTAEAINQMALAVDTAEPMDLLRTFADYPNPAVAPLLRQIAARKPGSGYLNKLLAVFEPGQLSIRTIDMPPSSPADQPVESFSQREIEVLQHIAGGLSNQEIADEMVLALSTVKWYLRNIYDKLQVNRRTQALAKARELNLITLD